MDETTDSTIPKVSMKAHQRLTVVIKLGTDIAGDCGSLCANSILCSRLKLYNRREDPSAHSIRSFVDRRNRGQAP